MDRGISRKMLRTMEPYHGMIYFVPEALEAYERIGLTGRRMGYFASRAAPLGPVPADVVIATFFNFHPALVRKSIPAAWSLAEPSVIVEARLDAADAALRRILGAAVSAPDMIEAAALAQRAALACVTEGRPLFAAHAALPWPDDPHLVLWHAQTLLRECRGDAHIAALVCEGVSAPEALVIHGATGDVAPATLQASRAWPDDEWHATVEQLRARGWLTVDGSLTDAGRASRQWVEDRTDDAMLGVWAELGEQRCQRLRELVRPFSRQLIDHGFARSDLRWDG
jgi:hypothetical protein